MCGKLRHRVTSLGKKIILKDVFICLFVRYSLQFVIVS